MGFFDEPQLPSINPSKVGGGFLGVGRGNQDSPREFSFNRRVDDGQISRTIPTEHCLAKVRPSMLHGWLPGWASRLCDEDLAFAYLKQMADEGGQPRGQEATDLEGTPSLDGPQSLEGPSRA